MNSLALAVGAPSYLFLHQQDIHGDYRATEDSSIQPLPATMPDATRYEPGSGRYAFAALAP
ncbi:MAG: hypothetical protein IH853_13315 [Bacteroidetes bacterium]|nr:hypothetical protein [Bacteroidota bacterium]